MSVLAICEPQSHPGLATGIVIGLLVYLAIVVVVFRVTPPGARLRAALVYAAGFVVGALIVFPAISSPNFFTWAAFSVIAGAGVGVLAARRGLVTQLVAAGGLGAFGLIAALFALIVLPIALGETCFD